MPKSSMRSEQLYLADILDAYFSVDWRIVFVTVTDDLPALKAGITALLEHRATE